MEEILWIKPPPNVTDGFSSTTNASIFLYAACAVMLVVIVFLHLKIRKKNKLLSELKVIIAHKAAKAKNLKKELNSRTQSMQDALKNAEESNRLKSLFLANMSHEIRTPLNGIIGFSELITEQHTDDKTKKIYSHYINQNSEQLLKFFDQIFHLAIVETGKANIKNEKFLLSEFLQKTTRKYQKRIKSLKKNIDFIFSIDDEKYEIETDQHKLKLILENLLDNALKFTDKGYIELSCKTHKESFIFEVNDSGCGLKEDEMELIFDPFRQGTEVMSKITGGSGLGLANVKNYVVLLGGKIWCASNKPNGSKFCFTIPTPDIEKNDSLDHLQYLFKN